MSARKFFCALSACRAGQQAPSPCTVKPPHKGREFSLETPHAVRSEGDVWVRPSHLTLVTDRELSVGIATYGIRRKRLKETTTIPNVPRDAA